MSTINFLLGAFALAICFNACFSQNLTSNAKTCSDCNSTNADCNPKQGYVMCSCKSGFIGNGLNCTRVVFCDTASCCSPGYTWDSSKKLCVDVDECQSSSLYTCLTQAECINKNGIYICNAVKNPVCPSAPCSFDQDCVRNGADLSCVDPCTNYQQIDGSQRLYNLNSVGRFPTDRYLFGWYRYANGLSLKEGFVGSLKCGSVQPYTLSSHPSVSEGVKSVPLLTNGLTANSTGPSIMVKACPGGYYVYKFAGLMTFEVYCTAPPIFCSNYYNNYDHHHINNDYNTNNNYYDYTTNYYTNNNHYNTNYYTNNNHYNTNYYSTNYYTNNIHYNTNYFTYNNQCFHNYTYYNTNNTAIYNNHCYLYYTYNNHCYHCYTHYTNNPPIYNNLCYHYCTFYNSNNNLTNNNHYYTYPNSKYYGYSHNTTYYNYDQRNYISNNSLKYTNNTM
ncbi:uromodulin-like [Dendrobates tinctorius]|uniref:uromodulin-like n=1 Tax=Dendrobates tinctorius TaxID=92724 RepID=UPI003CC92BFE